MPREARVTVVAVCAAGALCAAPAAASATAWGTVAVLAVLYALCEPGVVPVGRHPPSAVGPFVPVLLAGALILPPSAAALVAVPGSLAGRPLPWVRRCWRAGHLAVAVWTAALAARLLGGPAALRAADLPYALLPAAVAALVFSLVSTALTGAVLVTAERCPPATAWGDPLPAALGPHLTYGLVGLTTGLLWLRGYGAFAAVLVPLPMYVACWVFARARRVRAAHDATVRALVQAVDLKDPYTRGHSERVGRASALIAAELGMDDDRVDTLRLAGILHDIGKLGVPTRVLRKSGPLDPEERRLIQLHPEYGHEMTRGVAFLEEARAAILHHHERLDGSGYPHGLAGAEIPEPARVVAVADAFDAMTSTRSYRPARPVASALAELQRCSGTHFDPPMVAALTRALTRQPDVTAPPDAPAAPGGPWPATAPTPSALPSAPGPAPEPAAGRPAPTAAPASHRVPRQAAAPTSVGEGVLLAVWAVGA
ncbi:HD domain-containing protein [Streptomyces sp. PLK6-54]|uniref:HD domain-containing protein n=1 Tax=Actinacidiphila acidipaludis TaxID=2873382 RepID=A0ABS7QEW6_9ACTN|nr:HD domain-containing protein [Streptomyces acidipaludis]